MNKIKAGIAFALLLGVTLTGCALFNTPPSASDIDNLLDENYSYIMIVTEFLIDLEYDAVYISDTSQKMFADFNQINITKSSVNSAIRYLWENKVCRGISKQGNTIQIRHWSGSQEIGCGLAYSINHTDVPEIQFVTELSPLSKDGWYYYVDNYNKWRNEKTNAEVESLS